jgi:type II secretory pathway pseudopilin PulG
VIAERTDHPRASRRRAGFSLIELTIAGGLLIVAMTVTAQVVGWVARERLAVERRERALLEAENLMERALALPWDGLTTESAGRLAVSESTARFLRRPTLDVTITPFDDAPARKRVSISLRWLDRAGQPEAPVRLVAWVHRAGEANR